jgi:hypothetical protein
MQFQFKFSNGILMEEEEEEEEEGRINNNI